MAERERWESALKAAGKGHRFCRGCGVLEALEIVHHEATGGELTPEEFYSWLFEGLPNPIDEVQIPEGFELDGDEGRIKEIIYTNNLQEPLKEILDKLNEYFPSEKKFLCTEYFYPTHGPGDLLVTVQTDRDVESTYKAIDIIIDNFPSEIIQHLLIDTQYIH